MSKKTPLNEQAKARIMRAAARRNDGKVPANSSAARAQRSVDKRKSK